MIILPAIDIRGGQCVRLYKGDFATAEKVAEDPLATAQSFAQAGAAWLHTVDLDGAVEGRPVNKAVFEQIVRRTPLKVEVGGGIRNMDTIAAYLDAGVSRVILGSAALSDPALVAEAIELYGSDAIAVGIDAREGMVQAQGWLAASTVHYIDLARAMTEIGVETIIFTDISRDGTLSGPNLEQLTALQQAVGGQIIASGGIRDLEDIKALRAAGLYGAICGKSLYKGTLDLAQAIQAAR